MTSTPSDIRPVRPGEELPLGALTEFLRKQLPEFSGELEVLQFPHGHSNLTYFLRSGEKQWVLRRPPFGNKVKSAHDMGREYRVLSALSRVYPAAPRPLAACEDEGVMGAPFYVMEYRSGLILRREWPKSLPNDPQLLRRMCESLVDQLAELHQVDVQQAGLGELGKPEGYVARQIQGWTKRYQDAWTDEIPEIEAVAKWLAEQMPAESGASLIHNDFKFDNVVFDPECPDRIVAILDWEMTTLGDPLMDLGTTLGYWAEAGEQEILGDSIVGPTILPGALTRREVVARYAERTGREPASFNYYFIYGLFKIAVIVQQIYVRYVRGFTQDPRFAQLNDRVRRLAIQASRAIQAGPNSL